MPLYVLIADGDGLSQLRTRAAVERLGNVCAVAGEGGAVLASVERQRPAVVIVDWRLDGLDGPLLARTMRERAAGGYTYLIALADEADGEAAAEAMEAGADELLKKPLDGGALERALLTARRVLEMHEQLRADARVDVVTGIPNRHAMREELAVLLLRAARYDHGLAVVMFSVDRFRSYAAGLGYRAGDELLRRVATTLRRSLRGSDSIYRYGAEKFLTLLPGQDVESATVAAERLRGTVRKLGLHHPSGGVVTVSGGLATVQSGESAEHLVARVDRALNAARRAGPDSLNIAPDEVGEPAQDAPAPQ